MSSLPRSGVCAHAADSDSRAETASDLGSNQRASESLLGRSTGSIEGLHDRVSETVSDRWHKYGGVTFCGIPVAQYWAEFALWESLLNERPYDAIVELGTLDGGFSLFLDAQARFRGSLFRTYDICRPAADIPGFVKADIYACAEQIGQFLSDHQPVILFCDGGNKPRELKTFSQYLGPDSTLVVHDWMEEMLPEQVPNNVEMVHEKWCIELGSASRVFRVKDAY